MIDDGMIASRSELNEMEARVGRGDDCNWEGSCFSRYEMCRVLNRLAKWEALVTNALTIVRLKELSEEAALYQMLAKPIVIQISSQDEPAMLNGRCAYPGCIIDYPHYHRDTLDGEEVVRNAPGENTTGGTP